MVNQYFESNMERRRQSGTPGPRALGASRPGCSQAPWTSPATSSCGGQGSVDPLDAHDRLLPISNFVNKFLDLHYFCFFFHYRFISPVFCFVGEYGPHLNFPRLSWPQSPHLLFVVVELTPPPPDHIQTPSITLPPLKGCQG